VIDVTQRFFFFLKYTPGIFVLVVEWRSCTQRSSLSSPADADRQSPRVNAPTRDLRHQQGSEGEVMRLSCILLCALAFGFVTQAQESQNRLTVAGRWEGTVQVPGNPIRLVIDLAQQDRQWVGSLIAPDFSVKGAPVTGITVQGAQIEFALKHVLGEPMFKAHLENDGTLTGEYMQGGNKALFIFKRIGDAMVDFPEQGTPVSKDLLGEWKGSFEFQGKTFHVILKLPNSGTPTAPSGQFVMVEENATFPIGFWKEGTKSVFFTVERADLNYEGQFRKNPPEIAGELRHGPFEVTLSMHPNTASPATDKPAAVPAAN
jgi:hypothetical protein